MMTSEELNRVLRLRRELESECRRLADLKAVASAAPVPVLDGLPHSRATTSRPENFAVLIAESERRISELAAQMDEAVVELSTAIYESPVKLAVASSLVLRYCAGLSIEEISKRLQFTYRYVQMLIRAGERALVGAERAGAATGNATG